MAQIISKYGLLITHTDNIGDEIQSLAVKRFLPRVDAYVDRDRVNAIHAPDGERMFTVLNGWWSHNPENWPPSASVMPLPISFHISPYRSPALGVIPSKLFTSEPAAEYLRYFGPVGARDLGTLQILQSADIPSYFSGCLTLTLDRPEVKFEEDLVVVNDVSDSVVRLVAERTRKRIVQTRHAGYGRMRLEDRFVEANSLLDLYAKASCVITTRLHCALPCVAMETPVLLIDTGTDPERFSGLKDFVNVRSAAEFEQRAPGYDVNQPPANPGTHYSYRNALIKSVSSFISDQRAKPYPFGEAHRVRISYAINGFVAEYIDLLRKRLRAE